ncbi:hypothetical protein V6R21_05285 [Limibacter armeniacum]|uniref:hypothetical protein n=1 Tax=Limibacter armeniacum TaxID=466084 RepID=UPI002FE65A44
MCHCIERYLPSYWVIDLTSLSLEIPIIDIVRNASLLLKVLDKSSIRKIVYISNNNELAIDYIQHLFDELKALNISLRFQIESFITENEARDWLLKDENTVQEV